MNDESVPGHWRFVFGIYGNPMPGRFQFSLRALTKSGIYASVCLTAAFVNNGSIRVAALLGAAAVAIIDLALELKEH